MVRSRGLKRTESSNRQLLLKRHTFLGQESHSEMFEADFVLVRHLTWAPNYRTRRRIKCTAWRCELAGMSRAPPVRLRRCIWRGVRDPAMTAIETKKYIQYIM